MKYGIGVLAVAIIVVVSLWLSDRAHFGDSISKKDTLINNQQKLLAKCNSNNIHFDGKVKLKQGSSLGIEQLLFPQQIVKMDTVLCDTLKFVRWYTELPYNKRNKLEKLSKK